MDEREQYAMAIDREDLLAILEMRFGEVPEDVQNEIRAIQKLDALERLILVAANVPRWEVFLSELREGKDQFKIVGEMYNPLSTNDGKRKKQ
ncbi:MAG TPA: hypothetical protein VF260_08280 [Bacilli bacterium]